MGIVAVVAHQIDGDQRRQRPVQEPHHPIPGRHAPRRRHALLLDFRLHDVERLGVEVDFDLLAVLVGAVDLVAIAVDVELGILLPCTSSVALASASLIHSAFGLALQSALAQAVAGTAMTAPQVVERGIWHEFVRESVEPQATRAKTSGKQKTTAGPHHSIPASRSPSL